MIESENKIFDGETIYGLEKIITGIRWKKINAVIAAFKIVPLFHSH